MSIIGTIGDVLSSGGVGAIVGTIGSFFTKREERKAQKENNEFKLADRELDLKEQAQEQAHAIFMADKKMELTSLEGNIAVDVADSNAFVESVKGASRSTGSAFADMVKGMMRPLITTFLLVVCAIMGFKLHILVGGLEGLGTDEVFSLYREIIMSTIFLTMVAVTWWFGSRPHSKEGRK